MFSRTELRALPILSASSDATLDFLIEHSADMRVLKGEYILHEGDTVRALFVLVEGQIQVVKMVDDAELNIGSRVPGETFGELPLAFNTPLAVSFRAVQDARILRLDGRDFRTLISSAPGIASVVDAAARDRLEGLQEAAALPTAPSLEVIGPHWDNDTHELREFLERNSIDYDWIAATAADAAYPQVRLRDGTLLTTPSQRGLAEALGLNCSPQRESYDVAIVGGGPAGLAAAVYGASEGLSTLLIEREAPGGQAGTSSRIENYLGFPFGIAGADLAHRALEQAKRLGAEIIVTRDVLGIDPASRTLLLDDNQSITARTIVLATGVAWRHLAIPALDRLRGRGVYYGAAPDEVRSVHGKDVFIIGGGNSAGQAAINLSNFASSVTLLVRADSLAKSMSRYLIDQLATKTNVHIATRTELAGVHGDGHLETISTVNTDTNVTTQHDAAALFVMIGADAQTQWLPPEIARDAQGFVLTPNLLETSVPGIFAVGDVRSGSIKRVAAGVGEGSMAIALVHQYLASQGVH